MGGLKWRYMDINVPKLTSTTLPGTAGPRDAPVQEADYDRIGQGTGYRLSAPKLGRWLTNGKREPISTRGHQSSVSSELTSLQVIGATAQRSPGSWFVAWGRRSLLRGRSNTRAHGYA